MIINQNVLAILKKEALLQTFLCKICKIFKNVLLYNTSERLLLTSGKIPQLLLLNFLTKFLTERKYLMNTLAFVK